MDGPLHLAAAVEAAAEPLLAVLDDARARHSSSISPTQLRVLSIIDQRPGVNVNRLAEILVVGPSSASRLCDRLEATGLLRRASDPRDRREVRLTLTVAAQTLLRELKERRYEAVGAVLSRMPADARQDLLHSLSAFAEAAASLVPAPPAPRRSARSRTA